MIGGDSPMYRLFRCFDEDETFFDANELKSVWKPRISTLSLSKNVLKPRITTAPSFRKCNPRRYFLTL